MKRNLICSTFHHVVMSGHEVVSLNLKSRNPYQRRMYCSLRWDVSIISPSWTAPALVSVRVYSDQSNYYHWNLLLDRSASQIMLSNLLALGYMVDLPQKQRDTNDRWSPKRDSTCQRCEIPFFPYVRCILHEASVYLHLSGIKPGSIACSPLRVASTSGILPRGILISSQTQCPLHKPRSDKQEIFVLHTPLENKWTLDTWMIGSSPTFSWIVISSKGNPRGGCS